MREKMKRPPGKPGYQRSAGRTDLMTLRLQRRIFHTCTGIFLACLLPLAAAMADDDDEEKHPDMHALAANPGIPKAHKDFSAYRFRPEGDLVVEQPDTGRLLFRTKDGRPDGYAVRRGGSIVYYNAAGHPTRVQHLTAEEQAR